MDELRVSSDHLDVVALPERGGRLHRLRAFGHDLLRTPDDPAEHVRDPFSWGGYVMAPWCNRIAPGRTDVGERTIDMPPNHADGSAIHGEVHGRPWQRDGDARLVVDGGGEGRPWPWEYEVSLGLIAVDASLRIELRLRNRSTDAMPAGLGLHPWFRRPVLVAIHGRGVLSPNTGTPALPVPVDGPLDLRRMGQLARGVDATWTDLADPPVELAWPAQGIRAVLRASAPSLYIVAAGPGDIDAIAIEPQTHAPQGLRRLLNGEPGGLTILRPNQVLGLDVDLAFERTAD